MKLYIFSDSCTLFYVEGFVTRAKEAVLNDVCKLYCNDSVERHSIFPRKRTINNESKLLDVVQIRKMSSHH